MNLGAVIHSYGGPVLFVWAWLQGEAAVIVGGSLAAQGYWPWWTVWLIAAIPATLGHQLYFALGRRFGDPLLALLPARVQPAIARARALVHSNDARVMVLMRSARGKEPNLGAWAGESCRWTRSRAARSAAPPPPCASSPARGTSAGCRTWRVR